MSRLKLLLCDTCWEPPAIKEAKCLALAGVRTQWQKQTEKSYEEVQASEHCDAPVLNLALLKPVNVERIREAKRAQRSGSMGAVPRQW